MIFTPLPRGRFCISRWTMWISRGETHIGSERIILKLNQHLGWEWAMVGRIISTILNPDELVGRIILGRFLKSSSIHLRFFRFPTKTKKITKKGPKKITLLLKRKFAISHLKNRWLEDDPFSGFPFWGFGFNLQVLLLVFLPPFSDLKTFDHWGCSGCMSLRVSGGVGLTHGLGMERKRWNDLWVKPELAVG